MGPFDLPDLSTIRRLSETSDYIEQRCLDLSLNIGGICVYNQPAFACAEDEIFDFELISESLRPWIALGIFKTVVFPCGSQISTSCIGATPELVTSDWPQDCCRILSSKWYKHCTVSFIGKHNICPEYIQALSQSCILSLIPVLFILFDRERKADLGKTLDCLVAFEGQDSVSQLYRRAGCVRQRQAAGGAFTEILTNCCSIIFGTSRSISCHLVRAGIWKNRAAWNAPVSEFGGEGKWGIMGA